MKENFHIVADSHRELVEGITRHGIPEGAEVIYSGRNTLYIVSDRDGTEVCIKEFHIPRFPNNLIYTNFRRSKAERSYTNALKLKELGFGTPEPYGYSEVTVAGCLTRSYYFCHAERTLENIREWDRFPFVEDLLEALAREMVKLHKAGVFMRDFSPGNILFSRDAQGNFSFSYVDLNRMEFGVFDRHRQMRNFRAIYIEPEQTARIARKYALVTGADPDLMERIALWELENYFAQKRRNGRLKSLLPRRKNHTQENNRNHTPYI